MWFTYPLAYFGQGQQGHCLKLHKAYMEYNLKCNSIWIWTCLRKWSPIQLLVLEAWGTTSRWILHISDNFRLIFIFTNFLLLCESNVNCLWMMRAYPFLPDSSLKSIMSFPQPEQSLSSSPGSTCLVWSLPSIFLLLTLWQLVELFSS